MSSRTTHPNIAKITRQIETIDAYCGARRLYDAWIDMIVVMRGLKPAHKRMESYIALLKEIQYSIRRIDNVRFLNAPDAAVKKIMLARLLDTDFQSRFMSLLWDCNMLSEGAYRFFDPSGDKSSDKVKIDLENRNIDNIR